ncbi:hypothetical protein ACFE04_005087 [Oxalis oulophora]
MIGNRYEDWVNSADKHDNLSESEEGKMICPKEGKGKRLWKKVKYQLVEYHSLPGFMKDNEFILGYYRAEWPLKQVFLSIFSIHNETLNVWTSLCRLILFAYETRNEGSIRHLIGFFLFLFLTVYTATRVPEVVSIDSLQRLPQMIRKADLHKIQEELSKCLPSIPNIPDLQKLTYDWKTSSMDILSSISSWNVLEHLKSCLPPIYQTNGRLRYGVKDDVLNMIAPLMFHPITRWPFYAFLGGAMFCLLASSTCHLLSCHSERLSYIMLRFDYAGIAALIATSFYPPVYYSFMCNPLFCNLYLGTITVLGIATIIFSLLPVFQKPEFRVYRASLFFGMGMSGVAPILHKLILYRNLPEAIQTTGYEVLMGVFYGLGALIYAARIPERWKPGKFDLAGHSHQLFHVLVVAGAYTHYRAGLIYLQWRDSQGC